MRLLIVLSAVLLAQSAAFGQTCANGQCQRPGYTAAAPQSVAPRFSQAAPSCQATSQPARVGPVRRVVQAVFRRR